MANAFSALPDAPALLHRERPTVGVDVRRRVANTMHRIAGAGGAGIYRAYFMWRRRHGGGRRGGLADGIYG